MILKGQCWSRDLKKAIRSSAFSLLEVMVVTVMMTIILYGLYSMFNQTQKSFRSNNAQVDVMNTARSAMDVIARDVELLAACNTANGANLMTLLSYPYNYPSTKYNRSTPMIQTTMPGDSSGPFRTNFMQDFFFLQKQSNYWIPCGYFVGNTSLTNQANVTNTVTQVNESGVGSLYRIGFSLLNELGNEVPSTEYDTNVAFLWMNEFRGWDAGATRGGYYRTNANLVAEGVVHFSVRCFDSQGQSIEYQNYHRPNETSWDRVYLDSSGIRRTNMPPQKSFNIYAPDLGPTATTLLDDYLGHGGLWRVENKLLFPTNEVDAATNVVILGQTLGTTTRMVVTDNLFLSNAIPSYVEIELGLLEPQAWDRLKAIGNDDVRRQYLMKNSGRVHLFRKRIPIRRAFQ
jgi:type II secretory pathway pseudopilin PulG